MNGTPFYLFVIIRIVVVDVTVIFLRLVDIIILFLLITILQTYLFRKFVDEEKVRATMRENAKKPRKKGFWATKLEEAQKQQQAMLREQQRRGGGGKRR